MDVVGAQDRIQRVTASATWAAYADALGFITELTDLRGVKRRAGGLPTTTVAWRRRVGGRGGPDAHLPAGCYSDDTQLRLAVGRAVSARGFDVEAFARVELPVWPSYALGGGRASKAAAAGLSKANIDWYANFYDGWSNAGGNGAAMRIQPHIWAAPDPTRVGIADVEVVLDAITTHGHPRGVFGAVLHGRALARTLVTGTVPGPEEWLSLLAECRGVLDLVEESYHFSGVWRPQWETDQKQPFAEAWTLTDVECERLMALAAEIDDVDPQVAYAKLADQANLTDPALRGSGTVSAVASLALAFWAGDPERAALVSAHALDTDTDTIGTMAAALCGAASGEPSLPGPLMDPDYITAEARRLAASGFARRMGEEHPDFVPGALAAVAKTITDGAGAGANDATRFRYPDLLSWQPPKAQADAYGLADGAPTLAGLGRCEQLSPESFEMGKMRWQWVRTEFGQSVLVKQRDPLPNLPRGSWPARPPAAPKVAGDLQHGEPTEFGHPDGASIADTDAPPRLPAPQGGTEHAGSNPRVEEVSAISVAATLQSDDIDRTKPVGHGSHDSSPSSGPGGGLRGVASGTGSQVQGMLEWLNRVGYSDSNVGYAMRRLSQVASIEDLVAFAVLIRQPLTHLSNTRDLDRRTD